jgi:hypothetical protein
MQRKFPSTVRVTLRPIEGGFRVIITDRKGGVFLSDGFSDGTKAEAREEAWLALEELGLVTDGE